MSQDFAEHMASTCDRLYKDRDEARDKAIDALARYKFAMFGYWAGIWVHLNQIIGDKQPSPFKHLVRAARNG
jgi:hypothetical protein